MSRHNSQFYAHGYTLIELLVVVAIMIVSVAMIIPAINKFVKVTKDNTAKNAFNVATTVIRTYATRSISDALNANGSTYSGVAVIVTPTSELRLVENNQFAMDSTTSHDYIDNSTTDYHGYIDIYGRDYITMPKDTGIVGILTPTGNTRYISPPFAIRFDDKGQLAVTNDAASYVYYDGNYDGYYTITSTTDGYDRSNPFDGNSNYKVEQWDPNQQQYWTLLGTTDEKNNTSSLPGKYTPSNDNDEDVNYGKYKLPFEKLEAVIGVIIYSKSKLRENGGSWPGTTNGTDWPSSLSGCETTTGSCTDFEEWLQDNGQVMFFSRYTGALLQHK